MRESQQALERSLTTGMFEKLMEWFCIPYKRYILPEGWEEYIETLRNVGTVRDPLTNRQVIIWFYDDGTMALGNDKYRVTRITRNGKFLRLDYKDMTFGRDGYIIFDVN